MSEIRGLKVRPSITTDQQDQKVREVAEMYEKHFLRELVKSMRSTVGDGGLIQKSQAEQIFSEQLDQQYVEQWGNKGGIGLADMIQKQIIEKFGVQMGLKAPTNAMRGPVPLGLKDREGLGFKTTKTEGADLKLTFQDLLKKPRDLTNPFEGYLTSQEQNEGWTQLSVEHLNGFRSHLKFPSLQSGGSAVTKIGDAIPAGQSLGQWSSKLGDLEWQLEAPLSQPKSRVE